MYTGFESPTGHQQKAPPLAVLFACLRLRTKDSVEAEGKKEYDKCVEA